MSFDLSLKGVFASSPGIPRSRAPFASRKGRDAVLGEDVRCILNWMLSMP